MNNISSGDVANKVTTTSQAQISISPAVQDRIVEQLILQSGGVGLGVLLAFAGAVGMAKWLGVGTLIKEFMKRAESGTESLRALANALDKVTGDLKDNHHKYIKDHENILDAVGEVKDIVKDITRKLDK